MSRYIDVDKATAELWFSKHNNEFQELPTAIKTIVNAYLISAPIADVVERKRGVWKHINSACYGGGTMKEVICNKCHEHQLLPTNFCPNCGADMRGDGNERNTDTI